MSNTLPILRHFQDEINRLFNRPFFDFPSIERNRSLLSTERVDWYPEVDIEDRKESYSIKCNLPNVDPKNVEIYFKNGVLIVHGKTEAEREENKGNYIVSERSYGSFYRSFPLANVKDDAKIEANYKKGVLEINVPKEASEEVRRIEVKSSE